MSTNNTTTFTNTDLNRIYYGTEFKINVNMEAISTYHMGDVDFVCVFYCRRGREVIIPKDEMIEIDEDNYVASLSSEDLGKGCLSVRYEADIPDADFSDGLRHEVVIVNTTLHIL